MRIAKAMCKILRHRRQSSKMIQQRISNPTCKNRCSKAQGSKDIKYQFISGKKLKKHSQLVWMNNWTLGAAVFNCGTLHIRPGLTWNAMLWLCTMLLHCLYNLQSTVLYFLLNWNAELCRHCCEYTAIIWAVCQKREPARVAGQMLCKFAKM